MESKYFRKFALGLIVDKDMNILIQDRQNHSKAGEKYGLFGGGIEGDENENDSLVREFREELGVELKIYSLWRTKEIQIEGYGLGLFHYFLVPLNSLFDNAKAKEGNIIKTTINDCLNNLKLEIEDRDILDELVINWKGITEKYLI